MFVREKKDDVSREFHFANAAKRFALDAKMFRCRAAVHVENKDDITFWGQVLKHYRPNDHFHFISASRNEHGRETSGVTQCLKYFNFLSRDFFICIDSDYRYLLKEHHIDVDHYVLQTYTYSFENHHCFADGLDDVCSQVTHLKNTVFDFRRFLKDFSHVLYDLFIWHLYFQNADPALFSQYEFSSFVTLPGMRNYPLTADNGVRALEELRMRVEARIGHYGRRYPKADLEIVKKRYAELGLTPDNVYFFVRGHNLYDLITMLCKEVCKAILRGEKRNKTVTGEMIRELYRSRNNLDYQLRRNIKYGAYLPIRKVEEDIRRFLGE